MVALWRPAAESTSRLKKRSGRARGPHVAAPKQHYLLSGNLLTGEDSLERRSRTNLRCSLLWRRERTPSQTCYRRLRQYREKVPAESHLGTLMLPSC